MQRHIPINGSYNIRDLGGYPTPFGETRWRRLLRADGLHRIGDEGAEALIAEGLVSVIDLRRDHELAEQPNPFSTRNGSHYHNIPLFDALTPEPQNSDDVLLSLYKQALETRQAEIADILTLIAEAPKGAVLFHCTAGKDRTGLIAALLLATAKVETSIIIDDYALTATMIAPLIDQLIENATARGADLTAFRRYLTAEPATMAETLTYLDERYGAPVDYLGHIGLSSATIDSLRQRLTGDMS